MFRIGHIYNHEQYLQNNIMYNFFLVSIIVQLTIEEYITYCYMI